MYYTMGTPDTDPQSQILLLYNRNEPAEKSAGHLYNRGTALVVPMVSPWIIQVPPHCTFVWKIPILTVAIVLHSKVYTSVYIACIVHRFNIVFSGNPNKPSSAPDLCQVSPLITS